MTVCTVKGCRKRALVSSGLCPDHTFEREYGPSAFERQTAEHEAEQAKRRREAADRRAGR